MKCVDDEIFTSKFINVIDNKKTRKNMIFIRIGTKSSSSYEKVTTQYKHQVLPPLIKMCRLSHLFLDSISADILKTINWSENERVSVPVICKNAPTNSSKSTSTSTSHDNPSIIQTLCPILDSININTSNLVNKHLDVIF